MKVKKTAHLKDLDLVILCGGLGKRFRKVSQIHPKPMAQIGGRPFLDFLLEHFLEQGIKRFILCVGYKGEYIKDYYRKSKYNKYLIFSTETTPLGTGGALKNAEKYISSDIFFVANGDSYCKIDLQKFTTFHLSLSDGLVSMALTKRDIRDDCGQVRLNDHFLITSFTEKKASVPNPYMNAGIYIFNKKILSLIPSIQPSSLEYDIFPGMVGKNIYGFITRSKVYDIGTPERYKEFLAVEVAKKS